jgi:putative endonuclease
MPTDRRLRRSPAQPDPARVAAFRQGLSAESRAALLLVAKGFWIAARRFKTPVGEVDIVARRRQMLLFVEVKARARYDDAAEAVTARQQERIIAAAQYWLAYHPDDCAKHIRFDVVLVSPGRFPRHIAGAFDAGFRAC